MRDNSFQFSQKVTGQERKVIAAVIAEALDGQVRYAGAPSFAYEAGGWSVDKDSILHSPVTELSHQTGIRAVVEALQIAGLTPEGNMILKLAVNGHNEATLENLKNLIASKETLLKKALGIDGELSVAVAEGEVAFPFWNATLNADELQAFITLAWRLSEQAKTQKRVSLTEKPAANEKYAFRCFLLRLGFIGSEFKTARKVLLSRLTGNGAFRSGAAKQKNSGAVKGNA